MHLLYTHTHTHAHTRAYILTSFYDRSQKHEKRLLASSCLSVRLTVRMEQLGTHWMDFHEILCLCSFLKSVEKKYLVLLKSENITGYFTGIFHALLYTQSLRITLYLNALHLFHALSCNVRHEVHTTLYTLGSQIYQISGQWM